MERYYLDSRHQVNIDHKFVPIAVKENTALTAAEVGK
jgi:hypothetical protein